MNAIGRMTHEYLIGNPQITFFKLVYKRHTNFAIEPVEVVLQGVIGSDKTVMAKLPRDADLVGQIYIVVPNTPDESYNYTPNCDNVFAMIDTVEILIGGQTIDKQTGEWLHLWTKLTYSSSKYSILMDQMMNPSENRFYIPLQFWFCRNPGLYIPLLTLEYHDVEIKIKFSEKTWSDFSLQDCDCEKQSIRLLCDYVFLDTPERRIFACNSHEYLIEQVQLNELKIQPNYNDVVMPLVYSFPVKELIWTIYDNASIKPFLYEMMEEGKIKMNGMDRIPVRDAKFFSILERYEHHTGGNLLCDCSENDNYYQTLTLYQAIDTIGATDIKHYSGSDYLIISNFQDDSGNTTPPTSKTYKFNESTLQFEDSKTIPNNSITTAVKYKGQQYIYDSSGNIPNIQSIMSTFDESNNDMYVALSDESSNLYVKKYNSSSNEWESLGEITEKGSDIMIAYGNNPSIPYILYFNELDELKIGWYINNEWKYSWKQETSSNVNNNLDISLPDPTGINNNSTVFSFLIGNDNSVYIGLYWSGSNFKIRKNQGGIYGWGELDIDYIKSFVGATDGFNCNTSIAFPSQSINKSLYMAYSSQVEQKACISWTPPQESVYVRLTWNPNTEITLPTENNKYLVVNGTATQGASTFDVVSSSNIDNISVTGCVLYTETGEEIGTLKDSSGNTISIVSYDEISQQMNGGLLVNLNQNDKVYTEPWGLGNTNYINFSNNKVTEIDMTIMESSNAYRYIWTTASYSVGDLVINVEGMDARKIFWAGAKIYAAPSPSAKPTIYIGDVDESGTTATSIPIKAPGLAEELPANYYLFVFNVFHSFTLSNTPFVIYCEKDESGNVDIIVRKAVMFNNALKINSNTWATNGVYMGGVFYPGIKQWEELTIANWDNNHHTNAVTAALNSKSKTIYSVKIIAIGNYIFLAYSDWSGHSNPGKISIWKYDNGGNESTTVFDESGLPWVDVTGNGNFPTHLTNYEVSNIELSSVSNVLYISYIVKYQDVDYRWVVLSYDIDTDTWYDYGGTDWPVSYIYFKATLISLSIKSSNIKIITNKYNNNTEKIIKGLNVWKWAAPGWVFDGSTQIDESLNSYINNPVINASIIVESNNTLISITEEDDSGNLISSVWYRPDDNVTEWMPYKDMSLPLVPKQNNISMEMSLNVPYIHYKNTNSDIICMKYYPSDTLIGWYDLSFVTSVPKATESPEYKRVFSFVNPGLTTSSFKLYNNRTPYFIYTNEDESVNILKYNNIVDFDNVDEADGSNYNSIAFDESNNIFVAIYDENTNKISVMKDDSGNWSQIGSEPFTIISVKWIKLIINSNNYYVFFQRNINNYNDGSVIKYNNTSNKWEFYCYPGFVNSKLNDYGKNITISENDNFFVTTLTNNSEKNGSVISLVDSNAIRGSYNYKHFTYNSERYVLNVFPIAAPQENIETVGGFIYKLDNDNLIDMSITEKFLTAVNGPVHCDVYEIDGIIHISVANMRDTSGNWEQNSHIYTVTGTFPNMITGTPYEFATVGAVHIEYFKIDTTDYIFVVQYRNNSGDYNINSTLYIHDSVPSLTSHQTIQTNGARHAKYFNIDTYHYLAIANFGGEDGTNGVSVESKIYKWNTVTNSFDEYLSVSTTSIVKWTYFNFDDKHYLISANNREHVDYPFTSISFTKDTQVNSVLYIWDTTKTAGNELVKIKDVSTRAALDWTPFVINNKQYLAVSNNQQNPSYDTTSEVYKLSEGVVPLAQNNGCFYLYSFAISPEEHQPSGTCNFSRIKRPELHLTLPDLSNNRCISVYATNYNLLTIEDGMGGVKYVN